MNFKINTLLIALNLALFVIMLVLGSSLYYINREVNEFEVAWGDYNEEISDKHIFFNDLTRDLGYGGMIQSFKNYLLRRDEVSLETARDRIVLARASVDNYSVLELSLAERGALRDIGNMLNSYADNLEIGRQLLEQDLPLNMVDDRIRVDDSAALAGMLTLESLLFSGSDAASLESNISYQITELRTNLGYGGMIHLFKNYIIRGEPALLPVLQEKFDSTHQILAHLRALALNSEEFEAVTAISEVVRAYQGKIQKAVILRDMGASSAEIDQMIRVDNIPAFTGLDTLVRERFRRQQNEAQGIAFRLVDLRNFISTTALLAIEVLLFISLALIWLIRTQVVAPVTGVTAIMKQLAQGKLDTGIPLQNKQNEIGDMSRALAVFRDAAVQQEADKQVMDNVRREAEAANAAKSEFISSMSHELRTPLNAILGFSQLLDRDRTYPLSAKQKEGLGQIQKSSRHLLDLINQVLDLSRIESGNLEISIESVSVEGVVTEALDMANSIAQPRGISVTTKGSTQDIFVRADKTRFRQVVLNLLSNAIKYNRDQGHVTIHCHAGKPGMFRLSIIDTGFGIAKNKQHQLFTRFNRLGAELSTIEGTGIGLSLTRDLVQMMDGRMGFTSEEGKGSTFWFELPATDKPAQPDFDALSLAGRAGQADANDLAQMSGRLLYVEDNPNNMRLMEMVFDSYSGITLEMAPTAELGLEIVDVVKPDLILLDLNLPGMDGFEALRYLREKASTRDLPIIAVSAHAMDRDIKRAMDAGFDNYITKPFHVDEVLTLVATILGGVSKTTVASSGDAVAVQAELDISQYSTLAQADTARIVNSARALPPAYLDIVDKQAGEMPGLISAVNSAHRAQDTKALETAAHTLKTCAGTFGARELWQLAQEVESQAKAGKFAALDSTTGALERAYERVSADIGRLLKDLRQLKTPA